MNKYKEKIEKSNKKVSSKKGVGFKDLFTLDNYFDEVTLTKQLPFVLFLFVLTVVYVWNSHYSIRSIREIGQVQNEIKELRWEFMTTKSELMNLGKQSKLAVLVDSLGLKELNEPPKVLLKK